MKDGEPAAMPVVRFASELRAWRTRLDWTQETLAAKLGYSGSHVSSVERMERIPVAEFAQACDAAFETPGTFARLHEDITKAAHPPWFAPFVHFEQSARRIHNWDARSFTGLLQTESYARAIIRAGHPEMADDAIERDVAARMERQKIFERELPPACWFVIGEAAFHVQFGGGEVMGEQIAHVASLATRHYVTVQVYPFTSPDCPGADGPVTIFDFDGQASAGYAEGYEAGRTIEAAPEVARLDAMFDHLRASALSPRESASWIAAHRRSEPWKTSKD
jgi:transcriptional regulator with XRE-family HTH domain